MLTYNAGLDVRFDITEAINQEQLIPEVNLTEDEEDEIKDPIKAARAEDGGSKKIDKMLHEKFDVITGLEAKLQKNKEDNEVATALAKARELYNFTKKYAKDSASTQKGAVVEEKKTDGAFVKEEVALDPAELEKIQKQIADQRAAEQAKIKAAVDKANAEVAAAAEAQKKAEEKKAAAKKAAEDAQNEVARLEALLAAADAAAKKSRRMLADLTPEQIAEIRKKLDAAKADRDTKLAE